MFVRILLLILGLPVVAAAQVDAVLQVDVRTNSAPLPLATVVINGTTYMTAANGMVSASLPAGVVDLTVVKDGFVPATITVTLQAGQTQQVVVDLQAAPTVEEEVIVSAARTQKRLKDQPMRVEVPAP